MVRLDCQITLRFEAHLPSTFVFNIEPAACPHQTIVKERIDIVGETGMCDGIINAEGTRLLRVPAAGPLEVRSNFVVDLQHVVHDPDALYEMSPRNLPLSVLPYVYPSRYCESDKLMSFAAQTFGWQVPGYRRIAQIAQWVAQEVQCDAALDQPSVSAAETLATRRGSPRQQAHLMIALCRALNVPARYVNGIDPGNAHARSSSFHPYVEVFLSGRWYLFDPSGLATTTGLVRLGTGRDASDASPVTIIGQATASTPELVMRSIEAVQADLHRPVLTDLPVSTTQAMAA